MQKPSYFRLVSEGANILLIVSFFLLLYTCAWEYSTRMYLKGFSDAIVPESGTALEKASMILSWINRGPARQSDTPPQANLRDPENTLNYEALLHVCGTATNAFVNLANTTGVPARRLLLLGNDRETRHVVSEIYADGRWIVVDPSFGAILRNSAGQTLTRQQLQNPGMLAEATSALPHYDPSYTYARTAHVHLSQIPLIGPILPRILNRLWHGWSDSVFWTMLLERESYAALIAASFVFFILVLFRCGVRWYGTRRLGLQPYRIRDQIVRLPGVMKSE